MANLYVVRDKAQDEFYVLADDAISASVAYKDWVEDSANGMNADDRLPVRSTDLVASEDPEQSLALGRVTLIFGPMS